MTRRDVVLTALCILTFLVVACLFMFDLLPIARPDRPWQKP